MCELYIANNPRRPQVALGEALGIRGDGDVAIPFAEQHNARTLRTRSKRCANAACSCEACAFSTTRRAKGRAEAQGLTSVDYDQALIGSWACSIMLLRPWLAADRSPLCATSEALQIVAWRSRSLARGHLVRSA
jgi:hypothetical protein